MYNICIIEPDCDHLLSASYLMVFAIKIIQYTAFKCYEDNCLYYIL